MGTHFGNQAMQHFFFVVLRAKTAENRSCLVWLGVSYFIYPIGGERLGSPGMMYFPTIMRSYLEPQNPRNQGSHDPKNAPVEVGSLSHYLRRFFLHPVVWDF